MTATSPRSAQRRCATLALGGGEEMQTLAALRAAKSVIYCEETIDDVYKQLRRFLCETGAVQPVGDELVRDGTARAGQLIVRFPTGTQPILKDGPTTAAMLSDSSDFGRRWRPDG